MVRELRDELIRRLEEGAAPAELRKEGYKKSTIEHAQRERRRHPTLSGGKPRDPTPGETPVGTATRVRLLGETIDLPGEMFILYYHVRARFPEYNVTKSQWIQDVVNTWVRDYGDVLEFDQLFVPHRLRGKAMERREINV